MKTTKPTHHFSKISRWAYMAFFEKDGMIFSQHAYSSEYKPKPEQVGFKDLPSDLKPIFSHLMKTPTTTKISVAAKGYALLRIIVKATGQQQYVGYHADKKSATNFRRTKAFKEIKARYDEYFNKVK